MLRSVDDVVTNALLAFAEVVDEQRQSIRDLDMTGELLNGVKDTAKQLSGYRAPSTISTPRTSRKRGAN